MEKTQNSLNNEQFYTIKQNKITKTNGSVGILFCFHFHSELNRSLLMADTRTSRLELFTYEIPLNICRMLRTALIVVEWHFGRLIDRMRVLHSVVNGWIDFPLSKHFSVISSSVYELMYYDTIYIAFVSDWQQREMLSKLQVHLIFDLVLYHFGWKWCGKRLKLKNKIHSPYITYHTHT